MFHAKKAHVAYIGIDIFFLSIAFLVPYILRYNYEAVRTLHFYNLAFPQKNEFMLIYALWAAFIIFSLKAKDQYATDRALTIPQEIWRVGSSLTIVSIVIGAVIYFAKFDFFPRSVFIANFFYTIFFLIGWRLLKRLLVRRLVAHGYHNFNVLVVGADKAACALVAEIRKRPFLGLRVVGVLNGAHSPGALPVPVLGGIGDFERVCKQYFIDEVFISSHSQGSNVAEISRIASTMHIGIRIVPFNFEDAPSRIDINYLGFIPLLTYQERKRGAAEFLIKRLGDICVSALLLVMLAPVGALIAVIIKISNPGPVLYKQKRMGRKGKIFNFYKFRSMVRNADTLKENLLDKNEVAGGIIFKIKDDPRITQFGRFLRKYSLDELPQLFNVLRGDMSLVGPRPFPVDESRKFDYSHLPRLTIRPGITGLAQIRGRSDLTFYRWVKWDIWYINNWSFWLDVRIILWTIPAVLKGRGAY